MNVRLSCLCLMISLSSFAQEDYTQFIECRKIKWASEAVDTIRFTEINLSLQLRQDLLHGKIKTALADENFKLDNKRYADAELVRQRIAPNRVMQTVDEDGNVTGSMMDADDPLFDEKYFDTLTNDLIEATRIFYIEKGKLLTYTPWLSVKHNAYTSWRENLGITNTFHTAFNNSYKNRRSLFRKAIFLGQANKKWDLHSSGSKMLKQLYEQNLIEALWPYINNKSYRLYDITRSAPIDFANVDYSLIDNRIISVPDYDSQGNPVVSTVPFPPLPLSEIQTLDIREDWFFNPKKHKAFSRIKTVILYARVWHDGVQDTEASPILKIVME
jgi:hypothetical protein